MLHELAKAAIWVSEILRSLSLYTTCLPIFMLPLLLSGYPYRTMLNHIAPGIFIFDMVHLFPELFPFCTQHPKICKYLSLLRILIHLSYLQAICLIWLAIDNDYCTFKGMIVSCVSPLYLTFIWVDFHLWPQSMHPAIAAHFRTFSRSICALFNELTYFLNR